MRMRMGFGLMVGPVWSEYAKKRVMAWSLGVVQATTIGLTLRWTGGSNTTHGIRSRGGAERTKE